jgi:lipopolysaccharide export system permease protein
VRLFRHVAARTFAAFAGALVAVVGLFLSVDFAENASSLRGDAWALGELYLNRAADVVFLVAPAAMLLAAAIAASGLRKTREYTAMRAAGLGPWSVVAPVAAVVALAAALLATFGDAVVVGARERADRIMAEKFHRTTLEMRRAAEPKRWFRGQDGRRIYHLRGTGEGGAFERVTILEIGEGFRLARRIDAARMRPAPEPGSWILEEVEERGFFEGKPAFDRAASRTYRFEEDPAAFAIRAGRPAQFRRAALGEQIALRSRLGFSTADFSLEWHRRLSYPLAGIPASLVALALALRRERKGHVTAALVEAVGVSFAYWGLDGVALSLGHSGRLAPAIAAWAPAAIFLVAGVLSLRRVG